MLQQIWQAYLAELRESPLIGPGVRSDLSPRTRNVLHFLFTTARYLSFYLLIKPIAWVVITLTTDTHIQGIANIPYNTGFIATPNHLSNYDPVVSAHLIARPPFAMTKQEYFKTPLLGGVVMLLGSFPVRRGEADRQAIRTTLNVIKRGWILVIFPEGTRSKTFKLQVGHPGAALVAVTSDAPILPVAIAGTENIMRRRKFGFLRRPRVDYVIGKPYNLKAEAAAFAVAHNLVNAGKSGRHSDMEYLTDIIMYKIAQLLPPEYQGDFTEAGVVARYEQRLAAKNTPTQSPTA